MDHRQGLFYLEFYQSIQHNILSTLCLELNQLSTSNYMVSHYSMFPKKPNKPDPAPSDLPNDSVICLELRHPWSSIQIQVWKLVELQQLLFRHQSDRLYKFMNFFFRITLTALKIMYLISFLDFSNGLASGRIDDRKHFPRNWLVPFVVDKDSCAEDFRRGLWCRQWVRHSSRHPSTPSNLS